MAVNKRYLALFLGLSLLALFTAVGVGDPQVRSFVLRILVIPLVYSVLGCFLKPMPRWLPLALLALACAAEGIQWLNQPAAGTDMPAAVPDPVNFVCSFIGFIAIRLWERSDSIPLPE